MNLLDTLGLELDFEEGALSENAGFEFDVEETEEETVETTENTIVEETEEETVESEQLNLEKETSNEEDEDEIVDTKEDANKSKEGANEEDEDEIDFDFDLEGLISDDSKGGKKGSKSKAKSNKKASSSAKAPKKKHVYDFTAIPAKVIFRGLEIITLNDSEETTDETEIDYVIEKLYANGYTEAKQGKNYVLEEDPTQSNPRVFYLKQVKEPKHFKQG